MNKFQNLDPEHRNQVEQAFKSAEQAREILQAESSLEVSPKIGCHFWGGEPQEPLMIRFQEALVAGTLKRRVG